MNTGTLISRLNFAEALATNGLNAAAKVDLRAADVPGRLVESLLADDLSPETRQVVLGATAPPAVRVGLLLGSPEFQRR
jgi:hypothetical protein